MRPGSNDGVETYTRHPDPLSDPKVPSRGLTSPLPTRPLLTVRTISWGAVLYGAVTGFAGALLVFLVLGIAGLQNDLRGQSILIFLLYAAFLVAGYVAGRFAKDNQILHGGIAAMTLFALQVIVSRADVVAVLFGGVTATIIGSAGGALGQWTQERGGGSQDSA